MRRSLSLLPAVLAALYLSAGAAQAQTVDDIIAKNLKAKGGEKWKTISALKMTGKVTLQGMEMPMSIYAKRPNLSRQEISLQDKKLVQAFDGTTPWMINPMMGTDTAQELTGPQADMMKADADFDSALIDYKAKGHTIELVGKEKLDAKDVYHLKVTKKSGHIQHYFLAADSGIELKTSTMIDTGGTQQKIDTELSNYQPVEGIMVPHTIKQSLNGTPVLTMTIEKVEFNPAIDDATFKMPGPATAVGDASIPTDAIAAPAIRAKCTKEWPDDFQMRKHCDEEQRTALTTLRSRSMTTTGQRTIRNKCAKDWPDDFKMRDHCETQQLKALAEIR